MACSLPWHHALQSAAPLPRLLHRRPRFRVARLWLMSNMPRYLNYAVTGEAVALAAGLSVP